MTEYVLIRPDSANYPVGLHDLEDAPPIYVSGRLTAATGVAVVGTRRCTRYGSELARSFGESIAKAGWTTVSGLARGIDAAAHKGTLDTGGHAVAVLGCGIDVVYPAENRKLHMEIVSSGGALISEYPPGIPPDRWRFPARNRLIAAMSAAVVVVEAGEKGGALITARLAAELGRPVLVVPGDVDRSASVGCNKLIRDGAYPVLGAADLVEELSLLIGEAPVKKSSSEVVPVIPDDGLSLDDLVASWSCTPSEALVRVGRLEAEGVVRRVGDRVLPS
jgi:DNA processing protein